MTSFWRIFSLELLSLVRSKTVGLTLAVSLAWVFAVPFVVKGDGTGAGVAEILIRYALGGVFVIVALTLVTCATGALARERAAKRLQLTLVRPVWYSVVALAKMAAHVAVGAFVFAVTAAVLAGFAAVSSGGHDPLAQFCRHILRPLLPTPREEALSMYDAYIADPETPQAIKRAKKPLVLRILAQRAKDHYQTVGTNETVVWDFALGAAARPEAVRFRFTNTYDLRRDVCGTVRLGNLAGVVSNITQAVVEVPLASSAADSPRTELRFSNSGTDALMLRPRRDVELLVPADAQGWNLVRTVIEMTAVLSVLVAFGVFLGAGLGRPVAIFVAFAVLIVGEMSPSVVDQYPDELESDAVDRVGLAITRVAASVAHPLGAFDPIEAFSRSECVEAREVGKAAASGFLAVPLALALLSALILPRKPE